MDLQKKTEKKKSVQKNNEGIGQGMPYSEYPIIPQKRGILLGIQRVCSQSIRWNTKHRPIESLGVQHLKGYAGAEEKREFAMVRQSNLRGKEDGRKKRTRVFKEDTLAPTLSILS